jgi:hypothetical protein
MPDNLDAVQLVSTPEAAEMLGVPESEFTRLAKVLALPVARAGSRTEPRMWSRTLIAELTSSPEADELRGAVARKEQIDGMLADLERRYPEWRTALQAAADALFNFNRYSKWSSCTCLRRRELYDLKDRVLRIFHELGLTHEVRLHRVAGQETECQSCEGVGKDWRGQSCGGCSGSGLVRAAQELEYLHFCFRIGDEWYNWHLPRRAAHWLEQVQFTETASERQETWKPRGAEKPVPLSAEEFLDAEAVVRFVLHKYGEEQEQKRLEERRRRGEEKRRQALADLEKRRRSEQEPPPGEPPG